MSTVLVVDDSKTSRTMLRNILVANGYEVIGEAENGQEGYDKYCELEPDFVTLDITMPVMDGIETLVKIKEYDEVEESYLENEKETIKVHITKAGETYLDLIATHFEFFSCRIVKKKEYNKYPLFMSENRKKTENGKYYFQFLIENVIGVVSNCCKKLNNFYADTNYNNEGGKKEYLESYLVYRPNESSRVFHGERIIHTHIRYIDAFRLYLLSLTNNEISYDDKIYINKTIIGYILDYMNIGKQYPNILSEVSEGKEADETQKGLFAKFLVKIEIIVNSQYTDFKTKIDI